MIVGYKKCILLMEEGGVFLLISSFAIKKWAETS